MTTAATITTLRSEFGALETIDPAGKTYARLCDLLDRCDNDALKAAYQAQIKFVSSLALNRLIRRKVSLV